MNPVLTGFVIAIPIYSISLFIYSKIKNSKELKAINIKKAQERYLKMDDTSEYDGLVAWIRRAKRERASERMIKKTLKGNGWDSEIITQAINQIKESGKHAKEKTKPQLPSGINTKQQYRDSFKLKGEDGNITTSTTEGDSQDLAESKQATSTSGDPSTGNPNRSERNDHGNEGTEQSGVFQLSSVKSSKPNKRKSKWDWGSIKQDR